MEAGFQQVSGAASMDGTRGRRSGGSTRPGVLWPLQLSVHGLIASTMRSSVPNASMAEVSELFLEPAEA